MSTSNPWLTPFQRSYNDIKAKLIQSLNERVPEITDMSEGNIFILTLSIFAGIAEVIHYYIDGMAREAFLKTNNKALHVVGSIFAHENEWIICYY